MWTVAVAILAAWTDSHTPAAVCSSQGPPLEYSRVAVHTFGQIDLLVSDTVCRCHCYLIIRNAEASLVEIESRDRHYKRILYCFFCAPTGANMNVNDVCVFLVCVCI